MTIEVMEKGPGFLVLKVSAENPAEAMIQANVAVGANTDHVSLDLNSRKTYDRDKPMKVEVSVGNFVLEVHSLVGGEGCPNETK